MKNFIKVLSLAAVGAMASTAVNAQVNYPYVLDFETATTTPYDKSYASGDTISAAGGQWVMPGVYLGTPHVTSGVTQDFLIGNRSARMRLDGTAGSAMTMITDLPLGADSVTFWTGMYGSETGGKIVVSYSTNQGSTWTRIGDTINVTGTFSAGQYVALRPNISQPVRLKIHRVNTSNIRVNVDNIRVTAAAQASNIFVTGKTPTGTILSTVDALTLTFNEDVVKGTGNITLNEVGGTPVVYDVATSTDVTIANNVVTIDNVTLNPSKSYFVTFDSTAFEDATGLLSAGIYDDTTWSFNTLAASLQNFTEDFTNCGENLMGVFTQNSVEGTAEFFCDTYNDSTSSFNPPYITINGGTGSESFLNEDYLVTMIPVDLTELDVKTVNLYYEEKRRFGGDGVTRGIYYSQDYTGDAANATWVAIDDNLAAITSTGSFFRRNHNITANIDPTQPFYLAFKYASVADTTNRNWSWSLDNIELEVIENDTNVSVNPLAQNQMHVSVIGLAKSNQVNVRVATLKAMDAQVVIYDLNGRKLFADKVGINAGTQVLNINNLALNTGMYILRLESATGSKAVKFVVE